MFCLHFAGEDGPEFVALINFCPLRVAGFPRTYCRQDQEVQIEVGREGSRAGVNQFQSVVNSLIGKAPAVFFDDRHTW